MIDGMFVHDCNEMHRCMLKIKLPLLSRWRERALTMNNLCWRACARVYCAADHDENGAPTSAEFGLHSW